MSGWNDFAEKGIIGTLRYGRNRYTGVSKVEGEETKATGNRKKERTCERIPVEVGR